MLTQSDNMTRFDELHNALDIIELARAIGNSPDMEWRNKYVLIFSRNIMVRLYELGFAPKYDSPRSDCKNGVQSYIQALDKVEEMIRWELSTTYFLE